VRPYLRSPVSAKELMQVGYVGLLKAIGNFDPAVGAVLAAYARPTISGELKRYFRDTRWPLHVGRPVQELVLQVRDATGPLTQQLGRTPADSDLARHLGVSGDEVRQARQAQLAFQPSSLDAPLAGLSTVSTLADSLGAEDPRLDHMLGMHAVAAHWGELPPREQQILIMDFLGNMTQAQIGLRLSISQMHVSRLRAHALGHLRARLLGPEPRQVQGSASGRAALFRCWPAPLWARLGGLSVPTLWVTVGAGGRHDGTGFAGEDGVDIAQRTDGGGTSGELDEPADGFDFGSH
jgi:RNA polymerase sigma-B factor